MDSDAGRTRKIQKLLSKIWGGLPLNLCACSADQSEHSTFVIDGISQNADDKLERPHEQLHQGRLSLSTDGATEPQPIWGSTFQK